MFQTATTGAMSEYAAIEETIAPAALDEMSTLDRGAHPREAMKNELRVLRAEPQLVAGDLAEKLGVSRQTVNALETGKYDPSLPLAFKIARLFEKRIEDVFEYDTHLVQKGAITPCIHRPQLGSPGRATIGIALLIYAATVVASASLGHSRPITFSDRVRLGGGHRARHAGDGLLSACAGRPSRAGRSWARRRCWPRALCSVRWWRPIPRPGRTACGPCCG